MVTYALHDRRGRLNVHDFIKAHFSELKYTHLDHCEQFRRSSVENVIEWLYSIGLPQVIPQVLLITDIIL